jgi:nitrous-oxide reductase
LDISKDGRIVFGGIYNLEGADTLEGMIKNNRDAVVALNIEVADQAVADGNYFVVDGVKMVDATKVPGLVKLIPVPKNSHGIDVTPDGKYAMASGKLSPTVSIIDIETLEVIAEPFIGLGPLHTTWDGRGNAYTTTFVDSQVVKWNVEKAIRGEPDYIVDRLDVHYNPGHLQAMLGFTSSPAGDYLISLNKLAKGRFLDMGPDIPENNQLIDIRGEKMKLLYDAPADPEPHEASFVRAKLLDRRFR